MPRSTAAAITDSASASASPGGGVPSVAQPSPNRGQLVGDGFTRCTDVEAVVLRQQLPAELVARTDVARPRVEDVLSRRRSRMRAATRLRIPTVEHARGEPVADRRVPRIGGKIAALVRIASEIEELPA